jgi:cation:H+ antiporter
MVLGAAVLAVLCRDGALAALPALALLGVFLLGLAQSLWEARAGRAADGPSAAAGAGRGAMALRFCGGLAGILIGSQLLIRCGSALARLLGVPEAVIGVTLVAVGTSLPELVTALTAIARREAALSVGNILGANLIDLTLILPVCALLSGGEVPIGRQTTALDLPVCLTLCLAAVLPPLAAGRLSRWQGAVLLGLYAAYAAVLVC